MQNGKARHDEACRALFLAAPDGLRLTINPLACRFRGVHPMHTKAPRRFRLKASPDVADALSFSARRGGGWIVGYIHQRRQFAEVTVTAIVDAGETLQLRPSPCLSLFAAQRQFLWTFRWIFSAAHSFAFPARSICASPAYHVRSYNRCQELNDRRLQWDSPLADSRLSQQAAPFAFPRRLIFPLLRFILPGRLRADLTTFIATLRRASASICSQPSCHRR